MPIINRTVTIELTRVEVEEILKEHFKDILNAPKIEFCIREEGGDPLDRFRGSPAVYKVRVEGIHK
jgi:hypothetical protein